MRTRSARTPQPAVATDRAIQTSRLLNLPAELQLWILEDLLDMEYGPDSTPSAWLRQLGYLSICHQWRWYLEPMVFECVTLTSPSGADHFSALVQGERKQFVKWIWVRLALPAYGCDRCRQPEDAHEIKDNNGLFTKTVWRLFVALSQWSQGPDPVAVASITLELSACSPSDQEHHCKELKAVEHDTAWSVASRKPAEEHNDIEHGWERGHPTGQRYIANGRAFGTSPLSLDMRLNDPTATQKKLPHVSVIKALVIRLQCYRNFSVRSALKSILESLVQLREVRHETWRRDPSRPPDFQGRISTLVCPDLPNHNSLRRVFIILNTNSTDAAWTNRPCSRDQAHDLVEYSLNLEELHVAGCIEAGYFLRVAGLQYLNRPQWENLKFISLSSNELVEYPKSDLILAAGRAAKRMPKLKCMEVWAVEDRSIGIFQYTSIHERPLIRLLTTWSAMFSAEEIATWREATSLYKGALEWKNEKLPQHEIEDHCVGCIFKLLLCRTRLLSETSNKQLFMQ